eukprot:NODE_844_length_2737_cov_5.248276.p1 GENE.NODE_844_length_2737_cov_5.248276~~NODE_844_length_2737_cov_5.248276.p1  ORF type:complete len:894 (+),score=269.76 NODE_844_length_2737_cov_5.248276:78-2684(+)
MAVTSGIGLFSYHRKNFMFDKGLRQSREFQHQNLRIEQFVLYREDVRDLVNLTTQKMDLYMVMAALLAEKTVVMICKQSEVFPAGSPEWVVNLNALSLAVGMFYLLLTFWLAMYASISAQAFGVRLLTQFVRLPIADDSEINLATSRATDFEGAAIKQLLRVPILNRRGAGSRDSASEEAAAATATAYTASSDVASSAAANSTSDALIPTAMLEHIRLYRRVQLNWQAYDAYARVSLFVGASSLLYACLYWTLCQLYLYAALAAFGVAMIFAVVQLVLSRLDLRLRRTEIFFLGLLLAAIPLLGATGLLLAPHAGDAESWSRDCAMQLCALLAHALHSLVVFLVLGASWPDPLTGQEDEALLPGRFRSTLYLDVFGWLLNPQGPGLASGSAGAQPEAEQQTTLWQRFTSNVFRSGPEAQQPQHDLTASLRAQATRVMSPSGPRTVPAEGDTAATARFAGPEAASVSLMEERSRADNVENITAFTPAGQPRRVSTRARRRLPGETPWRAFTHGTIIVLIAWVASTVWRLSHCIDAAYEYHIFGLSRRAVAVTGATAAAVVDAPELVQRAACAAGGGGPVELRLLPGGSSGAAVAYTRLPAWARGGANASTAVADAGCGLAESVADVGLACVADSDAELGGRCVAALLREGGLTVALCELRAVSRILDGGGNGAIPRLNLELALLLEAPLSPGVPALSRIAVSSGAGGGGAGGDANSISILLAGLLVFGRAAGGGLLGLRLDRDEGRLMPAFDLTRGNTGCAVAREDERLFFADGVLLLAASAAGAAAYGDERCAASAEDVCLASAGAAASSAAPPPPPAGGGALELYAWDINTGARAVLALPAAGGAWATGGAAARRALARLCDVASMG